MPELHPSILNAEIVENNMLDTTPQKTATSLIFMPARNCEMYAAEALRSLSRQTMDDFFVLYVDDASEDRTGDIARFYLQELFPGRHEYIRNPSRFGKSRNVWEHLRPRTHLADFIAILDADDQLADMRVLQAMAENYAVGKDVVWTNYFTDCGQKGGNSELDAARSPREQHWLTSHFFSFRASLLKNVPEDYFKDSAGAWYMGACDVAIAMPILDQTRSYKFIPTLSYRYTTGNPLSLHNSTPKVNALTSKMQMANATEIRAKTPLPLAAGAGKQRTDMSYSKPSEPFQSRQNVCCSAWDKTAAELLSARFPALMTAQSMVSGAALSPLQAWSIAAQLDQQDGDILYLGNPKTALLLAAMLAEQPDRRITCLLDPAHPSGDIQSGLALAGLTQNVEIVPGPVSKVSVESKQCAFPSTAGLRDENSFSVVIVDPRAEADEETFSIIALPAISNHIGEGGFRFCALSTSMTSAQAVVQKLTEWTDGLNFFPGGLGGTGFIAAPAL